MASVMPRRIRVPAQRRWPERGAPGPHHAGAAAESRHRRGLGRSHRRQLASHHAAASARRQAARRTGGHAGRAVARRRAGGSPGAGAAAIGRTAGLGRRGAQALAAQHLDATREGRRLRRTGRARALARRSGRPGTSSPPPTPPTAAARRPGWPTATPTGVRCVPHGGHLACATSCRRGRDKPRAGAPAPAVAAPAERWLGAPVAVRADAEHALQAVRSLWNLRQFDLAARARGSRVVRDNWQRAVQPSLAACAHRCAGAGGAAGDRPEPVGLAPAQRRSSGASRRWSRCCKAAHPQVRHHARRAGADASRDRQRCAPPPAAPATPTWRPLLAAAAAAWPDGQAPMQTLRFEPGRLTLSAGGWSAEQVERFRARLRSAAGACEATEGRLVLSRGGAAEELVYDAHALAAAQLATVARHAPAPRWRARSPRERLALALDGPGARRCSCSGCWSSRRPGARCAARRRSSTCSTLQLQQMRAMAAEARELRAPRRCQPPRPALALQGRHRTTGRQGAPDACRATARLLTLSTAPPSECAARLAGRGAQRLRGRGRWRRS